MEFTVAIIGDRGVGKSTLLQRLQGNPWNPVYFPTKNTTIQEINFRTDQGPVKIIVKESNKPVEDVDATILAFDVTRLKTLNYVLDLITKIHTPMVLVGNMADQRSKLEVVEKLENFEYEGLRIKHFNVSSKRLINIEQPFLLIIRTLLKDQDLEFVH
jgi:GTP-binding nuclear protein Ran